jgi:hypothetical protein
MQQHHSPAQQTLHWLTVALMLCIPPVAWVLISVTEETPTYPPSVDNLLARMLPPQTLEHTEGH